MKMERLHKPRRVTNRALRGLTVAAAMLLGSLPALAAAPSPIVFAPSNQSAREWPQISNFYLSFLQANPQTKIETAVADIEGKGVGSIFVRFVSPATCADPALHRCAFTLLRWDGSEWKEIFRNTAASLAIGPMRRGMASLVIDGSQRWAWSDPGRYAPDITSLGLAFGPAQPASAQVAAAAQAALASSAATASLMRGNVTSAQVVLLDLGADQSLQLVSLHGSGICVGADGCPSALLRNGQPVWTGLSAGSGTVLAAGHGGLRDFALENESGYEIFGFDGSHYRPIEIVR